MYEYEVQNQQNFYYTSGQKFYLGSCRSHFFPIFELTNDNQ